RPPPRRGARSRRPWGLPGPDSHRLAAVSLSLGYTVASSFRSVRRPSCWTHTPAKSRRRWWMRLSARQEGTDGGKRILLVAGVGQDDGEATRTFLDEAGFLPILIQHLQPLGRDSTGGLASRGGHRVGRASRGDSTGAEGGVGAMEEGWDLLELFGSDLVTHRRSPRVESREHPPYSTPGPPG